jgi:phosphoribosylformimino-5-aminoimidazole carboxamide ribotide isomerase
MEEATEYSSDPVEVAKSWVSRGALRLHIVDLDGAVSGRPVNQALIEKIRDAVRIPIQVGGGIRTRESVEMYCRMGANQVILGTSLLKEEGFLEAVCQFYPGRIIAALDTRGGRIATEGWLETAGEVTDRVLPRIASSGVRAMVFTDIQRDGMLSGPNEAEIRALLKQVRIPLIASGGISSITDVESLMELRGTGLIGMIIGKALYDGLLDLPMLLAFVREREDAGQEDYSLS